MKLRIVLLVLVGAAGVGASFALADSGKHGRHADTSTATTGTTTTPACQRTHVSGTTSSPQTFTVTVTKADQHSSLTPGQVVTVTVGGAGQTVRVNAEGCATSASSLTAREVEVHAMSTRPVTTTSTTTTSTTGTTTTNQGNGDGGHHHHGHH